MNLYTTLALALVGTLATQALKADDCSPVIRRSAPNSRYIVNTNKSIVLDKQTGLTWKRCVEGQSGADCAEGNTLRFNWGAALSQASTSTFAGYKDWRLPNIKELQSLVEVACIYPAINSTVFPNAPSEGYFYWSSSPDAYGKGNVWYLSFDQGTTNSTSYNVGSTVRLVRGGQ